MENSSKALLITAAVLIVILLIAFSIKIFNSPQEVQQQATDVGMSISREMGDATEDLSSSFDINREIISGEITSNPSDEIQDSSTSTTSWHITNVEELKEFANLVNNGNNFEGITVYLDNDLDLNNEEWTPIGSTMYYDEEKQKNRVNSFAGIFDGQGNSIRRIKVEVDNYAGLFGYTTNEIKNLTVKDSNIKANNSCAGAIAATGKYINNCNSSNNIIKGSSNVGGIVGYAFSEALIYSCENTSTVENPNQNEERIIKGYGQSTGGIVGWINQKTQIQNCINKGKISGNIERVGGIVGAASISVTITRCVNEGEIELKYNDYAYNNSSNDNTGGIVGLLSWSEEVEEINKISYCFNKGKISGQKATGGIVGCTAQFNTVIEKCYNHGEIKGKSAVGGISGNLGRGSNIYNSYNIGEIEGEQYVGGITGNTYVSPGKIQNCYNIGEIKGQTYIGGITGINSVSSQIQNCPTDENGIKNNFINTANSVENIWVIRAGINNGYPVLMGMN